MRKRDAFSKIKLGTWIGVKYDCAEYLVIGIVIRIQGKKDNCRFDMFVPSDGCIETYIKPKHIKMIGGKVAIPHRLVAPQKAIKEKEIKGIEINDSVSSLEV